jgi:hypothetical protein
MSIGAIGGLTAAATAINALARPDSAQAQPALERDGGTPGGIQTLAQVSLSEGADTGSGRVDVKA